MKAYKQGPPITVPKKGVVTMRKSILLTILTIALIGSFTGVANASSYTYELTSNYSDTNVPLNAAVTVTAKTNDPNGYKVIFMWINPAHKVELIDADHLASDGNGYKVASSTCTLDTVGDWDVYALFLDKLGRCCFCVIIPVKIRHTTFNVIPEIPLLGTAGASIAMIAGFTYKMKRKPKKLPD
jgi:hypothetical protein